jgi:lipid-A-disaccharide synthase
MPPSSHRSYTIALSVGELSGDEHAAHVIVEMQRLASAAGVATTFIGMGGKNLSAQGCSLIVDATKSGGIMGFGEVLRSFKSIKNSFKIMKALFLAPQKPDLLIVVDYPDFNLRLSKIAKKHNVPVLYFIPPKLWAWRSGRLKAIRATITAIAAIFPFEKEFYVRRGYNSITFVGHPFCTAPELRPPSKQEQIYARECLKLHTTLPTLAILPGSRPSEIRRNLPVLRKALSLIKATTPEVQFVVPVASSLAEAHLHEITEQLNGATIVRGQSLETLRAADAALLKSGTSNLQAAFLEIPAAMFFIASPVAAFVVKRLVKLKEFSPVNIVLPHSIRELVQDTCTPEALAQEALELLQNAEKRHEIISRYKEVKELLRGDKSAFHEMELQNETPYTRVAKMALELLMKRGDS